MLLRVLVCLAQPDGCVDERFIERLLNGHLNGCPLHSCITVVEWNRCNLQSGYSAFCSRVTPCFKSLCVHGENRQYSLGNIGDWWIKADRIISFSK